MVKYLFLIKVAAFYLHQMKECFAQAGNCNILKFWHPFNDSVNHFCVLIKNTQNLLIFFEIHELV